MKKRLPMWQAEAILRQQFPSPSDQYRSFQPKRRSGQNHCLDQSCPLPSPAPACAPCLVDARSAGLGRPFPHPPVPPADRVLRLPDGPGHPARPPDRAHAPGNLLAGGQRPGQRLRGGGGGMGAHLARVRAFLRSVSARGFDLCLIDTAAGLFGITGDVIASSDAIMIPQQARTARHPLGSQAARRSQPPARDEPAPHRARRVPHDGAARSGRKHRGRRRPPRIAARRHGFPNPDSRATACSSGPAPAACPSACSKTAPARRWCSTHSAPKSKPNSNPTTAIAPTYG